MPVAISRPAALRDDLPDARLFAALPAEQLRAGNGDFGRLLLRLVRGLARIAGGDLVASRGRASLWPSRARDLGWRGGYRPLSRGGPVAQR